MAKLVHNYIDRLDKLDEQIIKDAENILPAIDIDELLKDPERLLLSLGDAFLLEHIDEVKTANKEGIKFAEKVLKRS